MEHVPTEKKHLMVLAFEAESFESGEQRADLQREQTAVLRSLSKMSPESLCIWCSRLTGSQHSNTYIN